MEKDSPRFEFFFGSVGRIFFICLWLSFLGAGSHYGPLFLSSCQSQFDPPINSQSYVAKIKFQEYFGNDAFETGAFFIFKALDNKSILRKETVEAINAIQQKIDDYIYAEHFLSPKSYYTYEANPQLQALLQSSYVSADASMTFLFYKMDIRDIVISHELAQFQRNVSSSIDSTLVGISLETTGAFLLLYDMGQSSVNDMMKVVYAFPIAILILGFNLQSWRLVIVALCTMILAILSSFTVMYVVSLFWNVVSFVPTVMAVIILAVSINHSLFLLSRLSMDLRTNQMDIAVKSMIQYAGTTIAISSFTLIISFASLVIFPFRFLQTIGVGAIVAVLMTLLSNLTFLPVIFLLFSSFFEVSSTPHCRLSCVCIDCFEDDDSEIESDMSQPLYLTSERSLKTHNSVHGSAWYWSSKFITRSKIHSLLFILIIFGSCIPLGLKCFDFQLTMDTIQIYPIEADSVKVFIDFATQFSPGILAPYYVLAVNNNPITENTVFSNDYFDLNNAIVNQLLSKNVVLPENILSVSYSKGTSISLTESYLAITVFQYLGIAAAQAYALVFSEVTNLNRSSAIIKLTTSFPPTGNEAICFTKNIRSVLSDPIFNHQNYSLFLSGSGPESVDAMNVVLNTFPMTALAVLLLVFGSVGFLLRSALYPLRLLLSIAFPMSAVYGLTWMIYGEGIFATRDSDLFGHVSYIHWLSFVMSISILIGLAIDYDLFLYSRISEYRLRGFSTRTSVVLGMGHSGCSISSAGMIMFLSFGSLVFSSTFLLQQFGFIMSAFLFIDTFIIRTMLVPAMIFLLGDFNWYPLKVSKVTEEVSDQMYGEY